MLEIKITRRIVKTKIVENKSYTVKLHITKILKIIALNRLVDEPKVGVRKLEC